MSKRRAIAEDHIFETLRGSLFDPLYGAQSFRTPTRIAIGESVHAVLATNPSIATLNAMSELIDALHRRAVEIRNGDS